MKKYIIKFKFWLLLKNINNHEVLKKSLKLYNEIESLIDDEEIKNLWNILLDKIEYTKKEDFYKLIKNENENILLSILNNNLKDYKNNNKDYPKYNKYYGWERGTLNVLIELFAIGKRTYLEDFFENNDISLEDRLYMYIYLIQDREQYERNHGISLDYFLSNYFLNEDFYQLLENLKSGSAFDILNYFSNIISYRGRVDMSFINKIAPIYIILENNLFKNNSKIIEEFFLISNLVRYDMNHFIQHLYLKEPENLYKYLFTILKNEKTNNFNYIKDFLSKVIYKENLNEFINEHKEITKHKIESLFNEIKEFSLYGENFNVENFKNISTNEVWFLKGTDYYQEIEKYELNQKLVNNLNKNDKKEKVIKI